MKKKHYAAEGYCPQCDKRVSANFEDFGIGAYEYWGAKGVDTDIRAICPECESELDDVECYGEEDLSE